MPTDYKPQHDIDLLGRKSLDEYDAAFDAIDKLALQLGVSGNIALDKREFNPWYVGKHCWPGGPNALRYIGAGDCAGIGIDPNIAC